MINSKYTCSVCREVFVKTVSDSEAIKEKNEIFGDIPLEKCDLVCDDCFKKVYI